MERTISLAPSEIALVTTDRLRDYDAVYLGGEFCDNRLPSPEDYKKLAAVFPGRTVTVTSLLNERGLARAAKLLEHHLGKQKEFEIVVNDWGLLRILRAEYRGKARPVLGRLIVWEIARMDKPFLNSFCREYGIKALEADCEDVLRQLAGFEGAVHYHGPYRFRSATRYCPHMKAFNSAPCTRACGAPVRLKNPKVLGEDLYLIGSAYFTPNRPVKNRLIRRTVETLNSGATKNPDSPRKRTIP